MIIPIILLIVFALMALLGLCTWGPSVSGRGSAQFVLMFGGMGVAIDIMYMAGVFS